MTERIKCDEGGYCKHLLERSSFSSSRNVKGLKCLEYVDMSTGDETGFEMIYTRGCKDRGLALNFCPFCGFSFYDLRKKGKKVGDKRGNDNGGE